MLEQKLRREYRYLAEKWKQRAQMASAFDEDPASLHEWAIELNSRRVEEFVNAFAVFVRSQIHDGRLKYQEGPYLRKPEVYPGEAIFDVDTRTPIALDVSAAKGSILDHEAPRELRIKGYVRFPAESIVEHMQGYCGNSFSAIALRYIAGSFREDDSMPLLALQVRRIDAGNRFRIRLD